MTTPEDSAKIRDIVVRSLRSVLPAGTALPRDDEDWVRSGLLDSMAHVEVLTQIEHAAQIPDLFARAGGELPVTVQAAIDALEKASAQTTANRAAPRTPRQSEAGALVMAVTGWGASLGSERVAIATVEQEFGLPAGRLSQAAGLESVCRAAAKEDEVSLARAAAQQALEVAEVSEEDLDWILATSETRVGVPSLGASLHSALLAPETCRILDVGGACAGVVNCLVVAESLFAAGKARCILVASADVHSRFFTPGKVAGEFGGLFGDGASAFVLQSSATEGSHYTMVANVGGCAGAHASALRVGPDRKGALSLQFDGPALARAAMDRLATILDALETASGKGREAASAFVVHQPNPRIVEGLLRCATLPAAKVPEVAKTSGNLGASTCGVALSRALEEHGRKPPNQRGPIFVAAVGPGLLWAGVILE